MPTLSPISNNFFLNLINRLGVRPPPPEAFLLSNVVTPVSLVDADVSIVAANSTQLLDTPVSSGVLVAPVANTVFIDTGPLAAGNYQLNLVMETNDGTPANGGVIIQRRNSANAANVWAQLIYLFSNRPTFQWSFRITLIDQERLRVVKDGTNATAGAGYQLSIWTLPA